MKRCISRVRAQGLKVATGVSGHQARHMQSLREDMHLRAFELIGKQGELVAYRTYAVCVMCRRWVEF